jgi:hypothetical protein
MGRGHRLGGGGGDRDSNHADGNIGRSRELCLALNRAHVRLRRVWLSKACGRRSAHPRPSERGPEPLSASHAMRHWAKRSVTASPQTELASGQSICDDNQRDEPACPENILDHCCTPNRPSVSHASAVRLAMYALSREVSRGARGAVPISASFPHNFMGSTGARLTRFVGVEVVGALATSIVEIGGIDHDDAQAL